MTSDDDRPPVREMPSVECWERIEAAPYGRLGTYAAGEMDLFPVNHGVDQHSIVFRTAPGTKLFALGVRRAVLFEVDGIDGGEAFSVVVKGAAAVIDRVQEIERAERLGVTTWAPGRKAEWVRITPRDVQGRAFELPPGIVGDSPPRTRRP
ncbi:pyridoxamine 5'-phosphate oxidase family protein [Agromyces endophyticus]|uniref:pyridoxamine 5'-phosphate oxidase family protein n=1 Tax=Agromyces sp. H17E-10 TaxID=2932244 RepID=UPI001FD1FA55|nr:pyridoxamine 5'-phosphate oxidase family protein [Agromyces sp. H17E-10]UOQ90940.1 pyridoxamine 5'-phosphate oxidase family protein [Agromyces sp. H17E-10]